MHITIKADLSKAQIGIPHKMLTALQQQIHEMQHQIQHMTQSLTELHHVAQNISPIFSEDEKIGIMERFSKEHDIVLSTRLSSSTLGVLEQPLPGELEFSPNDTIDGVTLDSLIHLLNKTDLLAQFKPDVRTMYVYLQRKSDDEIKAAEVRPNQQAEEADENMIAVTVDLDKQQENQPVEEA